MAVDWLAIKNDYINGGGSYRELSEKYNVPQSTIRKRAATEKWSDAKTDNRNKIGTKTEQKTQEKISDALSDEAALKVRLRVGLLERAAKWLEQHEEIDDTSDFRRMVQSCLDLGVMDTQNGDEVEDDGLMDALGKIAGNIFDDGDDSAMLPKEKEE